MEIDALNRMLEGMRENEDFRRRERSLDIPGIYQNQGGMGNVASFGDSGGFNFLGIPSGGNGGFGGSGGYMQILRNLATQQPQLGPDDFGSYTIPLSDPTYRSGFDYARSIAGGIPMEQVIAPGVSYSPEQPGGYTQEQLNIPRDVERLTPPPILPPTREPDDPRYFGTGIGGVNIPVDRKQIPSRLLPPIYGPGRFDIRDFATGIDGVQIPDVPTGRDFSIDREVLERPMISGLENRDLMDVDSLITQVPTGRDFSVDRERIPPQDFGYGPGVLPPSPPMDIRDIPPMDIRDIPPMDIIDIPPKINDQIFIDDRPIIDERIVDRGYGPGIMPPLPPMDIDKVIPPVDIPPIDIPFIPFIKPPSIMDRPLIIDTPTIMDRPTGDRFSIARSKPMGLF